MEILTRNIPARRGGAASGRAALGGKIAGATQTAVARTVARGAEHYDRARMLPRLIAAAPDDLSAAGPAADARILRLLAQALRRERALGRAGHWAYDLNRHIGLSQAYLAEQAHVSGAPAPEAEPTA